MISKHNQNELKRLVYEMINHTPGDVMLTKDENFFKRYFEFLKLVEKLGCKKHEKN